MYEDIYSKCLFVHQICMICTVCVTCGKTLMYAYFFRKYGIRTLEPENVYLFYHTSIQSDT